jgi:hypothetical protein
MNNIPLALLSLNVLVVSFVNPNYPSLICVLISVGATLLLYLLIAEKARSDAQIERYKQAQIKLKDLLNKAF